MKNLKFTVIDKKKLKNIKGGLPFREAAPFLGRFKVENKSKSLAHTKRVRRPLSGLDALIRPPVETSSTNYDAKAKKRVSFVFERKKLEKLKKIARSKKSYLKDILGDIVSGYIDEYEKKAKKHEEEHNNLKFKFVRCPKNETP